MSRCPSGNDHYVDPVTGVLKNLLGLTDQSGLEQAETSLAGARSFQLFDSPLPGSFDLAHLKAIHKYLFGDLYEWAGQLRDVDISKGGSTFANHVYIAGVAADVFRALSREDNLVGLGPDKFSQRAAYYLGELNAIHPFREGNGRAIREFINHIAYANGHSIRWRSVRAEEMLAASGASFRGDSSELADLIRRNLSRIE